MNHRNIQIFQQNNANLVEPHAKNQCIYHLHKVKQPLCYQFIPHNIIAIVLVPSPTYNLQSPISTMLIYYYILITTIHEVPSLLYHHQLAIYNHCHLRLCIITKLSPNRNVIHLFYQQQWNSNCQNLRITPMPVFPFTSLH